MSNTIYSLCLLSYMNSQVIPSIMAIVFLSNKCMNFLSVANRGRCFMKVFILTNLPLPTYHSTLIQEPEHLKTRISENGGKAGEGLQSFTSVSSSTRLVFSLLLSPLYSCCCTLVLCYFLQRSFLIFASFIPLHTFQDPV